MITIQNKDYLPLKRDVVMTYVPPRPGVLTLAVLLADETYLSFYIAETDNLRKHLEHLLSGRVSDGYQRVAKYLHSFQCYFTFELAEYSGITECIEKLLAETNDPVVRLKIFHDGLNFTQP